jgi:hypothetical protein
MKRLIFVAQFSSGLLGAFVIAALGLGGLPACGAPQHTPEGGGSAAREPEAAADTRTPIEQRRDTACDQLGPKLTACAVEDARADLTAGKISQKQFDKDTAPEIQRKNTDEFQKACKHTAYSSRQVRVLEVCFHEETQCGPLLDCLGHLTDKAATKGRGVK